MKARAELESYRAAVDLLGFSPVLVNYAIESQLKEIGIFCSFSIDRSLFRLEMSIMGFDVSLQVADGPKHICNIHLNSNFKNLG